MREARGGSVSCSAGSPGSRMERKGWDVAERSLALRRFHDVDASSDDGPSPQP